MVNLKFVGIGIMVAAVVLFFVGFSYIRAAEQALLSGHTEGVNGECEHPTGATCPYEQLNKLAVPKYVGLFGDIALFGFGLLLFLKKKPEEKALHHAHKAAKSLGGDEAKVFDLVVQSKGTLYQHELVEKLQLSKVQVTRLLDRLEGQGLIERKRRGMTNLIVLKQ
ncbi:MarR family transcriptional regulator [Candidatus Woesearchaeota archaeon]|nr:MarR family transcriptional regulator [Candidatus Woesearchaeota archaeon]